MSCHGTDGKGIISLSLYRLTNTIKNPHFAVFYPNQFSIFIDPAAVHSKLGINLYEGGGKKFHHRHAVAIRSHQALWVIFRQLSPKFHQICN